MMLVCSYPLLAMRAKAHHMLDKLRAITLLRRAEELAALCPDNSPMRNVLIYALDSHIRISFVSVRPGDRGQTMEGAYKCRLGRLL